MHEVICTVALAALSLALVTHALPNGAPQSVCYTDTSDSRPTLTPNHPAGNASDAPGGYFIDSDLRDTNFFYNGSEQRNYTSKQKQFRILAVRTFYPFSYTVLHGAAISGVCDSSLLCY